MGPKPHNWDAVKAVTNLCQDLPLCGFLESQSSLWMQKPWRQGVKCVVVRKRGFAQAPWQRHHQRRWYHSRPQGTRPRVGPGPFICVPTPLLDSATAASYPETTEAPAQAAGTTAVPLVLVLVRWSAHGPGPRDSPGRHDTAGGQLNLPVDYRGRAHGSQTWCCLPAAVTPFSVWPSGQEWRGVWGRRPPLLWAITTRGWTLWGRVTTLLCTLSWLVGPEPGPLTQKWAGSHHTCLFNC